jgi:hypothetical protein
MRLFDKDNYRRSHASKCPPHAVEVSENLTVSFFRKPYEIIQ